MNSSNTPLKHSEFLITDQSKRQEERAGSENIHDATTEK
jgi:hypothetical protein